MTKAAKIRGALDKKYQRVLATPAGFDFFVAIHDFIAYIETSSTLVESLLAHTKSNRDLNIPTKYTCLKQIYQGMEDIRIETKADLGHERYMTLGDLKKIRSNNFSDGNSFWKKREIYRKMANEIYGSLNLNPAR